VAFTFAAVAGRYRDASTGALVPEASIRKALDQVLSGSAQSMRGVTQLLIDGNLSLAAWQATMMREIKSAHLVGAALGYGGWASMDQSDFGWTGQRIRSQYSYLRGFAQDIAAGRQRLDGAALSRATMYADAARQTHRAAQARLALRYGAMEERNVLGVADHCRGCLDATSRGWVGVGELPPPGTRNCLSRCHCSLEFRMRVPAMAA
jgi:hypothetical protein